MSLLNIDEYTGERGLYVGAYLPENFAPQIHALCDALGLERPENFDLHCTVIYSREQVVPRKRLPIIKQAVNALVTSVQHWVGHNGKTYVVADIQSMAMCQLHSKFSNAGAKHSFSAFRPHITLGKVETIPEGFNEKIEELNWKLKSDPLHVAFLAITARDINDD